MSEELVIGAQRRYPNGDVKQAGEEAERIIPDTTALPTAVPQSISMMHGEIQIGIVLVENGYIASFSGKQYIGHEAGQLAQVITNAIMASRETIIPGGSIEVGDGWTEVGSGPLIGG